MSTYTPPLRDIRFAPHELAGFSDIAALPGYEDATPDLVDSVLDEAGKFSSEVLAPLNVVGDREGARWTDGEVATPPGFKAAYKAFSETRIVTANFYAGHVLSRAGGLSQCVIRGGASVMALASEQF